jgi:hypothetical protein
LQLAVAFPGRLGHIDVGQHGPEPKQLEIEVAQDPLMTFDNWIRDMPRAELGGLIKEYIAESNHNGWDGFSQHHLTGIRLFLEDVMRYHEHDGSAPGFATRVDNINTVP